VSEVRSQDIFALAYKALKSRRLRTGLTVLGIVIGTALIVALIASTSGLTANITAQMSKMGATTLTVMPSGRLRISDFDVAAISGIAGVKEVIPYYSQRLTIDYGTETLSVTLYGIDPNKIVSLYQGLEVSRGGLADLYDPTGVVVGASIYDPPEENLQGVDVGELLLLKAASLGRSGSSTYSFLVKGVLKSYGSVGFTNIDEAIFATPMGASLVFKLSSYSGMYVIASSPDEVTAVTESVQEYFGSDARIMSSQSMLETIQSVTNQLTLFMGGIAAVSLFVAGIGITNTMFVSIMERTREIGVMKAIGYRARDILTLFLAEASITGIIGGFLGTIAGTVLSFLLSGSLSVAGMGAGPRIVGGPSRTTTSTGFTPVITSQLTAFSLLFPIGISVLAGLYPAWRASRLNIVTALKYE
jgi:putative ABC transport system permease protein